jgi:hypothetical protein
LGDIESESHRGNLRGQGSLVAKLFAEHYADPFHETLVHLD